MLLCCLCEPRLNFYLSVKSNLHLHWFCITTLSDRFRETYNTNLNQSEVKSKPISWLTHTCFPTLCPGYWHLLQVLTGSMDCLSFVIGHSDNFGFGFTKQKTALWCTGNDEILVYFRKSHVNKDLILPYGDASFDAYKKTYRY